MFYLLYDNIIERRGQRKNKRMLQKARDFNTSLSMQSSLREMNWFDNDWFGRIVIWNRGRPIEEGSKPVLFCVHAMQSLIDN